MPELFLVKYVLKICTKFTGKHPCRSVISIKLQNNFIEITLQHGCSTVTLLHIFRTHFPKNNSGGLLLRKVQVSKSATLSSVTICNLCQFRSINFYSLYNYLFSKKHAVCNIRSTQKGSDSTCKEKLVCSFFHNNFICKTKSAKNKMIWRTIER